MDPVRIASQVNGKDAKAVKDRGLSVSDATRLLLTRVAAEKALPFQVTVPNAKTVSAMREADRGEVRRAASVGDLMANLNADD